MGSTCAGFRHGELLVESRFADTLSWVLLADSASAGTDFDEEACGNREEKPQRRCQLLRRRQRNLRNIATETSALRRA